MDNELKKGLAEGPLGRKGFSEDLQRRIENALDNKRTVRKPWKTGMAALCSVLALTAGFWWYGSGRIDSLLPGPTAKMAVPASADLQSLQQEESSVLRTALLIGLRDDTPLPGADGETPAASYRTLLLAPEQGRLIQAAQGSGILMPYKMEFWKIDGVPRTGGAVDLSAYQVSAAGGAAVKKPAPASAKDSAAASAALRPGKLLFAGNRYVAVAAGTGSEETLWVQELQQLAASSPVPAAAPLPHVTLREVLGSEAAGTIHELGALPPAASGMNRAVDAEGESWTLVRRQGSWRAQVASYAPGNAPRYELRDVPLSLPESVVSYDRLEPSWTQVRSAQPAAVDAFSSPNREMVAILTDRSLVVHPLSGGEIIPTPLLTAAVDEGESLVMFHWAQDPYIEQWKSQARQHLQP